MTAYSGHEGSIEISSTPVGELKEFSINDSIETFNPRAKKDQYRRTGTTIKMWDGSLTCNFDIGDTTQELLIVGASVDLTMYPTGDDVGRSVISGNAIVTQVAISSPENDVVSKQVTFTGNGTLTYGAVPTP